MPIATPITGEQTIHPNNGTDTTRQITYSKAQADYIAFRRQRIISAASTRDAVRDEYDSMPFLSYYAILKRADDQYIEPRKNAQDTAINLGTIRDKDTSLVEFAQSHDFEPVAMVFDEDDEMMDELAETNEDMVRKSLLMEGWKDKSKLVYRSMVAFGTALVEDAWVERWIIEKTLKAGFRPGMGSDKAEWEQRLVKQMDGAQAKLWDLRKCYPGDIRKFFMNGPQGQPFFFTVEYESYDVVKQTYGGWDRWDYVPQQVVMTPEISSASVFAPSWTLRPVSPNYVEIVKYYDPIANEFSLTLNGIDMLPIMERETVDPSSGTPKTLVSGYPLTEMSPSGAIPFAKYDLEPMHDFFYSKSQPGKMRVSAAIENMMVKLFVQMFKQKVKPTMGNKSGRQFGSEATDPGTTINDIREGDLFPILPNYQGATPADFSFFEIMKKELDKNSVERSWQGMDNPSPQDETATGDLNDRKAQTLKVASLFDGIISGNGQLYWLRTYNLQKNWTKPIDKEIDVERKTINDVYRTITMPTEISGGQKAIKKIRFTTSTPKLEKGEKKASLDDSMSIHQEELDYQKKHGDAEVRFVDMHPQIYASLKVDWFWNSVPVPNASDPLSYMLFAKQITDAQTMFGPESLNVKKLKHRFASLTGNDFDTWFLNEQELAQKQSEAAAAQANGAGAAPASPAQGGAHKPPLTIGGAAKGTVPAQAVASIMK